MYIVHVYVYIITYIELANFSNCIKTSTFALYLKLFTLHNIWFYIKIGSTCSYIYIYLCSIYNNIYRIKHCLVSLHSVVLFVHIKPYVLLNESYK